MIVIGRDVRDFAALGSFAQRAGGRAAEDRNDVAGQDPVALEFNRREVGVRLRRDREIEPNRARRPRGAALNPVASVPLRYRVATDGEVGGGGVVADRSKRSDRLEAGWGRPARCRVTRSWPELPTI